MSSTSEQQAKFSPQQAWGQLVKHFCTWQAYDAKFTQGMWKDPMGTIERKWGYTLVQVELLIAIAAIGCTVLARNQLTPAASSQEGTGDTGPTTKEPVSGFNFNLETDNSSLAMVAAAEKATGVAFETSGPPMDLEDFDRDRLIMQAVQFNQPWGQENMIVYCARGAQGNSACGFAGLNNASWSEPRLDDFPWQWSGGASLIGNKVVELELPSLTLVYDAQDRPTFLADEQEGIKLINAALDDGSILAGEVQRIDADGVEVNVKGNGGLLKKISGLIGKLLRTNEKVVQAQNVVAAFTLTPSSTPPPTETDKPTATATSTATLTSTLPPPTPRPTQLPTFPPSSPTSQPPAVELPTQQPIVDISPTPGSIDIEKERQKLIALGWPANTVVLPNKWAHGESNVELPGLSSYEILVNDCAQGECKVVATVSTWDEARSFANTYMGNNGISGTLTYVYAGYINRPTVEGDYVLGTALGIDH